MTLEDKKQKIIDFVRARMRERNDFPAMSHTVDIVGRQTKNISDTSVMDLTSSILDDFGLTNKLLKIVNSVAYINFQMHGKISTISRAVFVLGYDQVRNAALSLLLFENLASKALASEMKDSVIVTFFSAAIAKEVAEKMKFGGTEELFLCSIFYNLGRLLTAFYLPKQSVKIREVMDAEGLNENMASRQVLGITYEELGIGIAEGANFSEKIMSAMRRYPPGKVPEPISQDDMLKSIVNFSNELCQKVSEAKSNPNTVKGLLKRYDGTIPLTAEEVSGVLTESRKELARYARMLRLNVKDSPFLKRINNMLTTETTAQEPAAGETAQEAQKRQELDDSNLLQFVAGVEEQEEVESPDAILSNGIQEVAGSLMSTGTVSEILRTILEVMYRGMNFTRAFICIKDTKQPVMEGRFGFGRDTNKIVKSFKFTIQEGSDVFNLSLSRNADLVIENIDDPRFKSRIPDWFRNLLDAKTFIILPLVVKDIPIGLIYADKDKAGEIKIPPHQMTLLKTLRNQAVTAIQKKL